jgi:hypothetical protein
MNQQLACLTPTSVGQTIHSLHPILQQVIAQGQAELLTDMPEMHAILGGVLAYFEGNSKKWPQGATPELRMAIDGLRLLHRSFNLDVIDISLELRKKQILEAIGQ